MLLLNNMILGYSVGVKRMFGEGYVLCGNSTEFLDPVFRRFGALRTFEEHFCFIFVYFGSQNTRK